MANSTSRRVPRVGEAVEVRVYNAKPRYGIVVSGTGIHLRVRLVQTTGKNANRKLLNGIYGQVYHYSFLRSLP